MALFFVARSTSLGVSVLTWAIRALCVVALLGSCRTVPEPARVLDPAIPAPPTSAPTVEWSLAPGAALRSAPERLRPPRGADLPEGFVSSRLAFPTGAVETSVLMLERLAPAEVTIGQPFGYELRLTNLTSLTLEDVAVRENVGEHFRLERADPPATSSGKGATSWVFAQLGPHEERSILLQGYPQGVGQLTHFATVDYNALVSSTIRVVSPSLRLRLSGPSDVLLCRDVPVRLVVTNAGERPAFAIAVRGALPEGLFTADGARQIEFEIDRLKVGESMTFELPLQAGDPGSFLVRLGAVVRGSSESPSNVLAFAVREPVLSVALSGETRGVAGAQLQHEVRIANTGDGTAPKTVVTYHVPPGANVVSASDGGRLSGQTIVWRVDGFSPGAEREFGVTLVAMRPGAMEALIEATTECGQRAEDRLELELGGPSALSLTLADRVDPVSPGSDLTYAIVLTNHGDEVQHGLRLGVRLPDGLRHVGSEGASPGAQDGPWIRFEELAELAPGNELRWRLFARVPTASELAGSMTSEFEVVARLEARQLERPLEARETTAVRLR